MKKIRYIYEWNCERIYVEDEEGFFFSFKKDKEEIENLIENVAHIQDLDLISNFGFGFFRSECEENLRDYLNEILTDKMKKQWHQEENE